MRRGQYLLTAALSLAAVVSTACAQVTSKKIEVKTTTAGDDKPVVILDTSMGQITVELDRAKAPITVENFLKYVDDGYYDGLVFHRVIQGFMIQGGGMTADSNNMLKEKTPTYPPIKNESRKALSNTRGTIAMARTPDVDSATSQFFINHGNNKGLDYESKDSEGGYTAFGKVTDGMDVVDAIAKVQTSRRGRDEGVPDKPVVIKSIKRKTKS
jgi:peptidyl-prolyl cis-trans isomerase A (cyclophilin A)